MRRTCAFTLIELLVVISIIALLVSILLPALKAARASAQSVQCMSQSRQIGLAMVMYANDSDDYLTPYSNYPGGDSSDWHRNLRRGGYLPENWDLFTCPNAPNRNTSGTYGIPGWNQRFISYGYNAHAIGASLFKAGDNYVRRAPAKLAQIAKPSETILLTDSIRADHTGIVSPAGYCLIWPTRTQADVGRPHARHGGACNVTWVDGHVSTVKSPDPDNIAAIYDVLTSYYDAGSYWDRK